MKELIAIILFTLFASHVHAQFGGFGGGAPAIKGKISGVLKDSLTGQPISYATLSMKKTGKSKIINGALSEDDGSFNFTEVTPGDYEIEISFIGYSTKVLSNVETTKKSPDTQLGTIMLVATDYMLDEVKITEKRALFENKVDKIVFNAEDDSSITGGDAADVLRKVPLLSVDLEGNVSLRGSQNVRILVNGKPSGMFSSNVAEALKMFPADQIKKVEVITSPGAKYDGEGGSGIINIITKKENVEGVAGTVNASVGTRQNNANLNLNIGKGRFGLTTNASVFYSNPVNAMNSFSRIADSGEELYSFSGITRSSRLGFNGSASAFYDFNAYNSINSGFTLRGFSFDQEGTSQGAFESFGFNRTNDGGNLFSGFDWTLDFTRKFEDNEVKELTFATQVSGNVQNQENIVRDVLLTGEELRADMIDNDGDNIEITGQVDYVQPIGKSKLELGGKTVIRSIKSTSLFVPDNARSNVFEYDQDVYSAYASYNFLVGKLNIITGLRYESTAISGDGEVLAQKFSDDYHNWLPNVTVSLPLKNFRNLKIAYSKRIQRPSLFYINPFRNVSDFANISEGNPKLEPELTNQLELSYNTNVSGFTIFGSLYYKRTTGLIEQFSYSERVEDSSSGEEQEVQINSFANVGTNNSVGVNLFISKSVGKLTVRGGGDVYTYNATGIVNGQALEADALSYRLFCNGDFKITGTLKADFFGFFQAPRFTLQGQNPSFSIFGIGLRKEFGKASLGIRIIEPFSPNKAFNSDIQGDGFRSVSSFVLPFQSFGLNFSYKFGKVDFKERKSKVRNTDQKSGDGQGGQGGGQGVG